MLEHTSVTHLLKKYFCTYVYLNILFYPVYHVFEIHTSGIILYIFLYNLVFSLNIVFVIFLQADVHSYGSFSLMYHILLYNYTTIYLSILLLMGIFCFHLLLLQKMQLLKNIPLHFSLYICARLSIRQCSSTCRSKPIKRAIN